MKPKRKDNTKRVIPASTQSCRNLLKTVTTAWSGRRKILFPCDNELGNGSFHVIMNLKMDYMRESSQERRFT